MGANPNDTMTRLLFPGSTHQHKIFKGLEKLKKLECLKHPTCSATTIQETVKQKSSKSKEFSSKKDHRGHILDSNKLERQERIAKKTEKDEKEKEKAEKEKAEKERKEKMKQEKIER